MILPSPADEPADEINKEVDKGFIHTTPTEAVSQLTHKAITIGEKTFQIAYPGNADQLLDHPSTHDAFDADEYMPYWAEFAM